MPGVVSLPHGFGHAGRGAHAAHRRRAARAQRERADRRALVEPVIGTSILNGVPVEVEAEVEADDAPA